MKAFSMPDSGASGIGIITRLTITIVIDSIYLYAITIVIDSIYLYAITISIYYMDIDIELHS